ncbi:MAG: hypothetical protein WCV88_06255 [Patescibacteria group bacterium]
MNSIITISFILVPLFVVTGCLFNQEQPVSSLPANCKINEQQALDKANALVAEKNLSNWEESQAVTYQPEQAAYIITYDTSQAEIKLLGERSITVNCATGEASFIPRD